MPTVGAARSTHADCHEAAVEYGGRRWPERRLNEILRSQGFSDPAVSAPPTASPSGDWSFSPGRLTHSQSPGDQDYAEGRAQSDDQDRSGYADIGKHGAQLFSGRMPDDLRNAAYMLCSLTSAAAMTTTFSSCPNLHLAAATTVISTRRPSVASAASTVVRAGAAACCPASHSSQTAFIPAKSTISRR